MQLLIHRFKKKPDWDSLAFWKSDSLRHRGCQVGEKERVLQLELRDVEESSIIFVVIILFAEPLFVGTL